MPQRLNGVRTRVLLLVFIGFTTLKLVIQHVRSFLLKDLRNIRLLRKIFHNAFPSIASPHTHRHHIPLDVDVCRALQTNPRKAHTPDLAGTHTTLFARSAHHTGGLANLCITSQTTRVDLICVCISSCIACSSTSGKKRPRSVHNYLHSVLCLISRTKLGLGLKLLVL